MITYRTAKVSEQDECLRLINTVFQQAGTDIQFEKALPKVYAPGREWADFHFAAVDSEKGVRGIVACLRNSMHIGGDILRFGYVGSVSVHPDARGEGHMIRLMEEVRRSAAEDGLDFLILGGRRQRYAYYGYETAGVRYDFTVLDSCVKHGLKDCDASGVRFVRLEPGSGPEAAAEDLHRRQRMWIDRTPSFAECCASYMSVPYAAVRGDAFLGCVVKQEKSMDIAELLAVSGEAADMTVKAWQEQNRLKAFRITVAGWDTDMIARLWRYAETWSASPDARVLILNPRNTVRALLKLKAEVTPLRDGEITLAVRDEDPFTVRVERNRVTVGGEGGGPVFHLTPSEAAVLLLGRPGEPPREHDPYGWFPLPLCVPMPDTF